MIMVGDMALRKLAVMAALLVGACGGVASSGADAGADAARQQAPNPCPPGDVGDWPCGDAGPVACPCKSGLVCYAGQLMKPGCYVWPPDAGAR